MTARSLLPLALLLLSAAPAGAQVNRDSVWIRRNYVKIERKIPMRDGVELFTAIYMPRDTTRAYPFLMERTPYSVAPYGESRYPRRLGPSMALARDGYIFVYQDVRGKMMSGGDFVAVRPHDPTGKSVDEATDTYDTVEWLLHHVPHNNGRVGVWGVSAPGFYATQALLSGHPAIKAVSPQAPVTDWFLGDDRHHNGAFQLQASFSFLSSYGAPRPEPTTVGPRGFNDYGTPDGYAWYMDLGPLTNVDELYFHGRNELWDDMMEHGTYDAWWQARTPLPYLKDLKPAVLVVGGWYDAQDLYGPLKTIDAIRRQSPRTPAYFVMGPWWHGGWEVSPGDRYPPFYFGQNTAEFFRNNIERRFFDYYLKDQGAMDLAKASIFITGSNQWHFYDRWPAPDAQDRNLYLQPDRGLSFEAPTGANDYAEYVSDPDRPVPDTPDIVVYRDDRYVVKDQRFAATRPDVLVFESPPLKSDLTVAGRLHADLFVSTTGTASDYIVKLIDVYPGTAECELPDERCEVPMGGYQAMIRGEVMRAKFRSSFSRPEPMTPGKVTEVPFDMEDVAHTFKAGHRLMVQIQSTWFPMVDRNPQQYVDMYHVKAGDYRKATERVYVSAKYPSHLELQVLK